MVLKLILHFEKNSTGIITIGHNCTVGVRYTYGSLLGPHGQ